MKTFLSLILCCLFVPVFSSYKGTVYVKSKDGQTQTILSGVSVTDGQNVTKTDKEGNFSLPGYGKTRFITVTTPSGYTTTEYYIKIDNDKKSYDFILEENEMTKAVEHSFIQITDTEIHNSGTGIWTTYLKNYIQNEKPAFLIHTGDICYENGLRTHIKSVNSETMGVPVYYGIGNHDLVKGNYGEELYESIYGPTWYSFDIGNIHYVMTPMAHGDHRPSYTKEEVYRWLVNDLRNMKQGQSLVVFNHDILTTSDNFIFGINEKEFIDFRDYDIKAWIYGHWHYNYVRNQNGVYTICTGTLDKGGIDHSASAFRVINIAADNSVTTFLRYPFIKPQIAIVSPQRNQNSPLEVNGNLPLSANIYNSNAETKEVAYLIVDVESKEILSSGNIEENRSDWNWYKEITIPSLYSGKKLSLEIKALFSNGEEASSTQIFLYNKDTPVKLIEGEDWNTLLKNAQHTGGNNFSVGNKLNLLWSNNVGANIFMASPVIGESKVFVASTDDNTQPKSSVSAFDLQTGRLVWKYPARNSIKNTIAYQSGIILAQDAESFLYAIDASTGKLRWEKKLDTGSYPYLTEGLTIENEIVYAGTGLYMSAININTGDVIWQNTGWKKNEAATTTLTIADDVIISGSQWGALYGNDIKTGELLWKISEDGMSNRGASPSYHDGKLYIISNKSFFIMNPTDGKIITKKELSYNVDVTSTPYIGEKEIIFGTADKGIIALDKESLAIKWNISTNPSLIFTAPYTTYPSASVETSITGSKDAIYFGASDGYLYVVNPETGLIFQKINLGAPVFSTAALSGNILIACDYGGNVYAFISNE